MNKALNLIFCPFCVISTKLKLKHLTFFGSGAIFLLCFYAGWQIAEHSWNGELYIYLDQTNTNKDTRGIASVQEGVDSLPFSPKGVKNQQKTIVHSAKVQNLEESIQFSLGHPVLVKTGAPTLACQHYSKIDMLFIASEVSFHGHAPKLSMQVDCQFDINKPALIGPFTIPNKQILKAPIQQKLFRNNQGHILLFSDIQIKWPKKWILNQISFVDDTKEKTVIPFTSQKEEDYLSLNLY